MERERPEANGNERITQILNELNVLYKKGIDVAPGGIVDTENTERFDRITELEAELKRLRPDLYSQKEK